MPPGGQLPSFPPHLVATGQPPWIGAKKRGNPKKTARKAPDTPGPIRNIMLTKKRVRPGPGPDSPVHPELGDARSSLLLLPRGTLRRRYRLSADLLEFSLASS